ncbi:MAG: putative toxin-antitoxin system toxin component, PIN family [Anaerolineales bacterium]|nr:putative toxin-antitoxin system toxin component, PIN family [Anaerolineales bacterium]
MRAVIDTNILVRALIKPDGTVGPVLRLLRDGQYTILYAQPSLLELIDVLNRPHIRRKYHLTSADIHTVLALILLRGEAVTPRQRFTVCRDPKDDKFLDVAVAGRADALVSGDEDLLVLHPFAGIPILTPRHFLQLLAAQPA